MPNMASPQVMQFVMLIGFVVVFYFLLIRPQKQQQKTRDEMLKSLAVGDKILTIGGVYGEITEIRKTSIRVKVAKDVILRMPRNAVQSKTSEKQED